MSRLFRRGVRAAVGAATAIVIMGVATAPTAQAGETYASSCVAYYESAGYCVDTTSNVVTASRAIYNDSGNTLYAYDDAADGRSAVVKYWPKGKPGAAKKLWNRQGHDTRTTRHLSARENSSWVIQACLGEWSDNPANRRVVSCTTYTQAIYI